MTEEKRVNFEVKQETKKHSSINKKSKELVSVTIDEKGEEHREIYSLYDTLIVKPFRSEPYLISPSYKTTNSYVDVQFPHIHLNMVQAARLQGNHTLVIYLWNGDKDIGPASGECILTFESLSTSTENGKRQITWEANATYEITRKMATIKNIKFVPGKTYYEIPLPLSITTNIIL
jgi:hypothetical protein